MRSPEHGYRRNAGFQWGGMRLARLIIPLGLLWPDWAISGEIASPADGSLALRTDDYYELIVPEGTALCGVFRDNFPIRREYEELARIDLLPGRILLPKLVDEIEADLIEGFIFSPSQTTGQPQAGGKFLRSESGEYTQYDYEQPFQVGDLTIILRTSPWILSFRDPVNTIVIDPDATPRPFTMYGEMETGNLNFGSCTYETLPLWYIDLQFAGGGHALLQQRYQEAFFGSGPSSLVYSEVWLPEGHAQQGDYWHLVYSAYRHNVYETFWTLFDEPIGNVHGLGVYEAFDQRGRYYSAAHLDEDLEISTTLDVTSYARHGGVVINELMPVNRAAHADEHGDFDPWIELHNMSDSDQELTDWYMTDRYEYPFPWQFPSETLIPAHGFLVVWLDNEPEEGPLHAAFRLAESGGVVGIQGSWPVSIWVGYGAQEPDTSAGRLPDGTGEIVLLGSYSPGSSNNLLPGPTPTPGLSEMNAHWTVH